MIKKLWQFLPPAIRRDFHLFIKHDIYIYYYRIYNYLRDKAAFLKWEIRYPFYRKKYSSNLWQYSVNAEQIYGKKGGRSAGVSGYYRIFNEEAFLAASVESHLPFFDEIILVHDASTTDKTPQICTQLAAKYPDKIKYYFYQPKVHSLRSEGYRILPTKHPNSFINYYNFALSKTTKKVVTKVDADHIAIDCQFEKITQKTHDINYMDKVFLSFYGLNLWLYNHKLYIDPEPLGFGDIGFYKMRAEKIYYTKKKRYEDGYFSKKNRQIIYSGVLYFHLKNMHPDISYISNRGEDDKSHQRDFQKRLLETQKRWLEWSDFVEKYHKIFLEKYATDLKELPDPNIYLKDLIKKTKSLAKIPPHPTKKIL